MNDSKSTQVDEVNIKIEPFRIRNVLDFYDSFIEDSWALEALIEMIGTCDLASFSDHEDPEKILRHGLQDLFIMCIRKQEEKVKSLREAAVNSPELILETAEKHLSSLTSGGRGNRDAVEAMKGVETILALFGQDEYPKANQIKRRFIRLAA